MELTIEQALLNAVESHKAGKLQDAESLYRAILQSQPNHPDANHNLGVMAVSLNKTEAALPLFKIALEANPNQGQFWLSYVDALIKEKQFDNARNVLEQGKKRGLAGEKVDLLEAQLVQLDINSKSQKTEANKLSKAIELRETGRYQEAQDWLTQFLEVEPSDAEGWSLLSQLFLLDKKDAHAEKALATAISINPNLPSIYRNQARLLLKNSKPEEALLKAQSGYEQSTDDPESWIVLAACLGANQRDLEALPLIEGALKARPNYAEAFANRALVRLRAKNTSGAIEDFEKACDLKPHLTQIWELLGTLRYQTKNLSGAIEALKKAQALEPNNVSYMIYLGEFLRQDQRIEEAIAILEEATEKAPENANAWINLGTALQQDNKIDNAQVAYKKALAINPNSAEVCNNLGSIAKDAKDLESARKYFEQAITIKPDLAEAHNNLGSMLKKLGRLEDAETSYKKAISLKPDFAEAYSNLGNSLKLRHRYLDALNSTSYALVLNPKLASAMQNYSVLLAFMSNYSDVCRFSDDALNYVSSNLNTANELFTMWEDRLYTWIYHPDLSAEEICAEHKRWGSGYSQLGREGFAAHDRSPTRRLRVGYVSPDFRGHSCRFFFEPLFSQHDHARFELFAYSNVLTEDEHTQRFKTYFDEWRNIRGVSDQEVVEMVRRDRIDILVDACGHMQSNRLAVFTHKPAPIQLTWEGYSWTTGLKQMDYALFDPYMAPPGTQAIEEIIRLPKTRTVFRPGERAVNEPVKSLPALKTGNVTFGYSGRTERLNYKVFNAWGQILKRLPQARLVLDYKPFNDPKTQTYYWKFLEKHSVDTTRVVMRSSENIFEGLGDIDILLDSFPHSGGTMLFDALWMGVPALTLASRPPVGRIGASVMTNMGLADWVAKDEYEYVDKAESFAKNVEELARLRAGMRERMKASPLMDEAGFARDVESAFKDMWHRWCNEAKLSDKVSDVDEITTAKSKLSSEQGE